MDDKIFLVTVPQLGVNEDTANLNEWYVSENEKVEKGQLLCGLETTKTVFDVESEESGYVGIVIEEGQEVRTNEVIGIIGSSQELIKKKKQKYIQRTHRIDDNSIIEGQEIRATEKAKLLAQKLGIDLRTINIKEVIREQDVLNSRGSGSSNPIQLSWMKDKIPVMIYGAGKGAITIKECLDFSNKYEVVCFVDDSPIHENNKIGLPVYHSIKLPNILSIGVKHCTTEIADGRIRLQIMDKCERLGIKLINVIHPRSYISPSVKMGKGNFIKAGTIIDTNTTIGDCCIIDNGVVIAHDNIIGDGCHLAPGVSLGSSIYIGKNAVIGIGVSVSTKVKIGKSSIITTGSSVIKDVPDFAIIEGVPGKIIGKTKK